MLSLAIVGKSPKANPDTLIIKVSYSGNYGVQTVGDLLNLLMQGPGQSNGLADSASATGYSGPFPSIPPTTPLLHMGDSNLGGYYTEINPGTTLQNFGLLAYAPGGGELNTNAAYPAAMKAGFTLIGLVLDQE